MSVAFYLNSVMGGLLTGLVYGLAALGLALIFNVVRVVNLAHGGMMVAGIYGATALAAARGTDPLLALPAVAAALFLAGFALQRLLIARTGTAAEPVRLLLMLGVGLMAMGGPALLSGRAGHSPPHLPSAADALGFGPFLVDRLELRAALVAMMVTALLVFFFNISRTGKAIRACADSPAGARVVGLDLPRLHALAFGLGAAVTGAAGCLLAQLVELRPGLAADCLLSGLIIVLIGGLGSVGGALLGGILVGVADALAAALLGPELRTLFGYGLLLLVLLLRPRGLLEPSR